LSWTETYRTIPDTSVNNPTMSAIFCRHDGAPHKISADPGTSGSNADCGAFHFGSEAVACRRTLPPAGAAQIMDFIVKTAGTALVDGGAVEFSTARTFSIQSGFTSILSAAS
jgi:hypothetical protein